MLEIILITYNRIKHTSRTLETFFADTSPVKNLKWTILDNKSTDGSSDVIRSYAEKFPNINHIIHNRNIGGNGNIARAMEIAESEYFWMLCNDDEYYLEHWNDVNEALKEKPDALVVSHYLNPQKNLRKLYKQLTFVPSAIYKTENITEDVISAAHFNEANWFPHLALASSLVNNNKKISFTKRPLIKMIPNRDVVKKVPNLEFVNPLAKNMYWELGYLNSLQMIKDKKTRDFLMVDTDPENKPFNTSVAGAIKHLRGSFRYFIDFMLVLNVKRRILFLILAPIVFVCNFEKRDKGIYISLFMTIKTKLIPFRQKKNKNPDF